MYVNYSSMIFQRICMNAVTSYFYIFSQSDHPFSSHRKMWVFQDLYNFVIYCLSSPPCKIFIKAEIPNSVVDCVVAYSAVSSTP